MPTQQLPEQVAELADHSIQEDPEQNHEPVAPTIIPRYNREDERMLFDEGDDDEQEEMNEDQVEDEADQDEQILFGEDHESPKPLQSRSNGIAVA